MVWRRAPYPCGVNKGGREIEERVVATGSNERRPVQSAAMTTSLIRKSLVTTQIVAGGRFGAHPVTTTRTVGL
jgi:hypothetical protein